MADNPLTPGDRVRPAGATSPEHIGRVIATDSVGAHVQWSWDGGQTWEGFTRPWIYAHLVKEARNA